MTGGVGAERTIDIDLAAERAALVACPLSPHSLGVSPHQFELHVRVGSHDATGGVLFSPLSRRSRVAESSERAGIKRSEENAFSAKGLLGHRFNERDLSFSFSSYSGCENQCVGGRADGRERENAIPAQGTEGTELESRLDAHLLMLAFVFCLQLQDDLKSYKRG